MQKVIHLRLKIKKGDKVKVMVGKDKGKEGVVEKVSTKERKVLVGGVNLYKKHARASQGRKAGIIDVVRPLPVANVAFVCPLCGKPTKLSYKYQPAKTRICRSCKGAV